MKKTHFTALFTKYKRKETNFHCCKQGSFPPSWESPHWKEVWELSLWTRMCANLQLLSFDRKLSLKRLKKKWICSSLDNHTLAKFLVSLRVVADLPFLGSNGRGGENCKKSSYHTKEQNHERKHVCDRRKCIPRLPPSGTPYAASINAHLLYAVEDISFRVENDLSFLDLTTRTIAFSLDALGVESYCLVDSTKAELDPWLFKA